MTQACSSSSAVCCLPRLPLLPDIKAWPAPVSVLCWWSKRHRRGTPRCSCQHVSLANASNISLRVGAGGGDAGGPLAPGDELQARLSMPRALLVSLATANCAGDKHHVEEDDEEHHDDGCHTLICHSKPGDRRNMSEAADMHE